MPSERMTDIPGRMSLKTKFVIVHTVLILAIVSALAGYFLYHQRQLLQSEMKSRSLSLATSFSRGCSEALSRGDLPAVGLAAAAIMNDETISFIRVRGDGGASVYFRSRRIGAPETGESVDTLIPTEGGQGVRTVEKDGLLLVGVDVRAPAAGANSSDSGEAKRVGEVIVGFSTDRAAALADSAMRQILSVAGLVAILGILGALGAFAFLMKPLKSLLFGSRAIAIGNFAFHVPVFTGDELGGLASSLNEMAKKLEDDRQKLDSFDGNLEKVVRERTEEFVRREAEWTRILEENPAGIVLADAMTRKVSWANPSALAILAGSLEEVRARFDRDGFPSGQGLPEAGADAPRANHTVEFRLTASPGTEVPVLLSVRRVVYNGLDHLLYAFLDITEYKQMEARLQQAQKMGAVGTLAGGIAHDFNNLLQAILGSIQLILLKGDVTQQGRKLLNQVEKAVQRGADLIRQLLTFSRKVESQLRPVDLNHEIRKIVGLLDKTLPRQVRIELDLSEDVDRIDADPLQLEQVITNLATNARDAMPRGGSMTLRTWRVRLDEENCKGLMDLEPGEYAVIRVSDTGTGMDRETLEHIFEPFFTTKEVGKGTGLGLAMVYGTVKSHGGHITCWSRLGFGTSFDIYLRPSTLPAVSPEPTTEKRPERTRDSGTILVVDDEEPILHLGVEALGSSGYTVLAAESGEKALELFEAERERIDLVILDLGMPGMGGHACFQQLKEMDPGVKVIIASGYTDFERRKQMLDEGAVAFVGKPYRFSEILTIIREALPKNQEGDSKG